MKPIYIATVLTLLLIQQSNAQVTSLTLQNFPQHFGCDLYKFQSCSESHNMEWFVMFMAPWCGHCKKAKPQFQAFDQHLKKGDIAKIVNQIREGEGLSKLQGEGVKALITNCQQEKQLCRQFGVRGYPTILYVTSDKKSIKYKGPRVAQSFTNFTLFHDPQRYSFGQYVPLSHSFWVDLYNEMSVYLKQNWSTVLIFGVIAPALIGYFLGNLVFGRKIPKVVVQQQVAAQGNDDKGEKDQGEQNNQNKQETESKEVKKQQ